MSVYSLREVFMEMKRDKKRKKVVLAIPALSTGGAEKLAYDIVRNIDKSLYDITVLTQYPSGEITDKEKNLKNMGIDIICIDKRPGLSIRCFIKTMRVIRTIQPDVIHSHVESINYLLPCYRKKQVKLHTVHSMAEFEASGLRKTIRWIAFHVCHVTPVAIGESVATSISKYYHIDMGRIPCIYNGVALPEAKDIVKNNREFTFVTVGTLYYVKNHKLLLRALKLCIDRTGQFIKLKIIGQGEMRSELEKMCAALRLEAHVEFLGWKENVYEELQKADAYVCSSVMEGISLSIIEAMACAMPIIASDVGGNRDLVKDGINGLLFESGDVEALANCMIRFVRNEADVAEMGMNSLRISKKFDIKKCVKEYESLYSGEK